MIYGYFKKVTEYYILWAQTYFLYMHRKSLEDYIPPEDFHTYSVLFYIALFFPPQVCITFMFSISE